MSTGVFVRAVPSLQFVSDACVYAWLLIPDEKAIQYSGAHFGALISFTTPYPFELDPALMSNKYTAKFLPVRCVKSGSIRVYDVEILMVWEEEQ
jgi:hypothetical protein